MEDTAVSGGNTGGSDSAPATFAEAPWSAPVDSPSAEPAVQDTPSPDTVAPGSEQAASPQQDERSPFIPRTRFDEVVTARQKAEQQLAEYRQQTAWTENEHAREAVQRIARHQGDLQGLLSEIVDDLAQTDEGAATLRSFLGRKFGGLRQQRQQQPEPPQHDLSQIQVDMGNGQALTLAEIAQQIERGVMKRVEPKLQTLETIRQEREQAKATEQASSFASSFEQSAKEMFPAFDTKTHGPAIAAELRTLRLPDNAHPSVVEAAALRALNKVMLPTLSSTAQSQLLDSLQQKAKASTAVNPASAAPTSTGNIRSFTDPALSW